MAVTHFVSTKTDISQAVLDRIEEGTGAGYIEILTSGDVECATLVFSDPAGTVTSGVLTFDPVNNDASATGGVAAKFRIKNANNLDVIYGSVAVSGGDLTISDTTIDPGDVVSLSAFSYTSPP